MPPSFMKRRPFFTRRRQKRFRRSTHKHPRYHHSHSRRMTHRRSKHMHRKRRGGGDGVGNQNSIVVASSNGTVRSLKDLKHPLLNANTDQLPGDTDV